MFSRVSLRRGIASMKLWQMETVSCPHQCLVQCSTASNSDNVKKMVENWDKANSIFFSPERDTKNFPLLKQPATAPPTRLGFIPATWFEAFYNKTGVLGPYVLGTGFITFLLSKEIWIVEHAFGEFLGYWLAVAFIVKKFGPKIKDSLDAQYKVYLQKKWYQPMANCKESGQKMIAEIEEEIKNQEGQKFMFEAKRENVDLQLEAIYRERLAQVHNAVKKRMDYQLEVENSRKLFEQTHMVNWIVASVLKSITPQQEKDSVARCIEDLKLLSAKA